MSPLKGVHLLRVVSCSDLGVVTSNELSVRSLAPLLRKILLTNQNSLTVRLYARKEASRLIYLKHMCDRHSSITLTSGVLSILTSLIQ